MHRLATLRLTALLLLLAAGCATTPPPDAATPNPQLAACQALLEEALSHVGEAPPDRRAAVLMGAVEGCDQAMPGFKALVVALTATQPVTIEVALPPKPKPEPRPMALIALTAKGALTLDGAEVKAERAALEQALKAHSGLEDLSKLDVGIAADPAATYQEVVGLMDLLRQAGVVNFAMVVKPE